MQQRRASEKKTPVDPNDGDSATGAATVRLRAKDKSATAFAPPAAPPPVLRLVNRPYSCDIESLSPSPINAAQPQQHHPYFYNHQAAVRQQSVAGSATAIRCQRLNASYQQLTSVQDDEGAEDDLAGRRGQASARDEPRQPPMAVQEDFVLEPNEPAKPANGDHLAAGQQKMVNYYVNLPSSPCNRGQRRLHPSQSAESSHGYSMMQRSASQCDFQLQDEAGRLPAPSSAAHLRLQYQRSAANSYYYANAGSDSNVSLTKPLVAVPAANVSGSDQMECLSSNYYPRSPAFGVIHQDQPQRRQLSGDVVMPLTCSSTNSSSAPYFYSTAAARDYGSASSIDRLAPLHKQHSSGSNIAAEASQRTQAANTSCAVPTASSSVVSKQHQQKQSSLPLWNSGSSGHRLQPHNFVVSVTSVDEERTGATSSLDAAAKGAEKYAGDQKRDRPPLTKTTSQNQGQQPQQHTPRGSLRRGKAVDLSFYIGESQSSRSASSAGQQSSTPSSTGQPKEKSQSTGRKGGSIFRKLIGGSGSGSKSGEEAALSSASMSASMTSGGTALATCRSGSSAGLGAGMAEALSSSKPDFSSDSCDFKYEERIRRRIFSHYDCLSICADAKPLFNGTSRLKDANLNAATGASQASKPYLYMGSSGTNGQLKSPQGETPTSPMGSTGQKEESSASAGAEDRGDGKCNDLILSCPFFRNECGGEPIRLVSLTRDVYQQHQQLSISSPGQTGGGARYSFPVDEHLETWHRPATAAEASVLENLSNVYLGGRLCAKRQPQLVIEHVDQGAFYYRHCFSGKAHQNYFGIDENLGPLAVSIVRDKMEVPDLRRLGLASPFIYRLIIRLSDLTTFRGAVLEESLPSYLSAKESREQQLVQSTQQIAQQSPSSAPGPGAVSASGMAASGSTSFSGQGSATSGGSGGSSGGKVPVKELLELIIPELQIGCLRLALPVPRTEELLLKLDEQSVYTRYKVGILYCRAHQSTEEQMYNNEGSSPAFDEFLDMLGQRVRLKGFDKYKGGLDSKGDTTGSYSLYTTYQQFEIMFHVSTLLPFTPQNRQQLSRKRHIGNDIVTVIFQEPDASPFSPHTVRSHFQHVFLVVRAHNPNTDNVRYSISVSRCKDVPRFGPPIPAGATFPKSKDFRDFLLTKVINAENAVHKSEKFAAMGARTRREFMRDLAENHVTSHSLESSASGKIASKLLGGSKRKDRAKPKLYLDSFCRGALVWEVQVLAQVEDFSLCRPVECYLGISADNLVLIERSNNEALFCTPTLSIIGWTSHGNSLKLYYDHADVIILRTLDDDDSSEMQEIIKRLQAVTKGCETVEVILRRNPAGQLGFHIQHEGIVSDVEMYGYAWQAGLRQGSRLVEICKVSVATLTYERMLELLRTSVSVRVLVIPPLLEDGSPRRGCEDPYCPAVLGDDSPFLNAGVPPAFVAEQQSQVGPSPRSKVGVTGMAGRPAPPSYETAISRRPISSSATGAMGLGAGPHGAPFTQSMTTEQSPELRSIGTTDYGYESGSGGGNHVSSTKSLDDFQNRRDRRHSEDLRSVSADHGGANAAPPCKDYYPASARTAVQDGRWHPQHGPSQVGENTGGARTDTLSSSGSTASSEMSSDSADLMHSGLGFSRHRPTRPSDLKRKVDKAHSDMLQRAPVTTPILERTSTDPCSSGTSAIASTETTPRAPPVPPKTYRNKHPTSTAASPSSGALSSLSSSTGHLAVPDLPGNQRGQPRAYSSSVQENLIRLINDLESSGEVEEAIIISSALQRTLSGNLTHHAGTASAVLAKEGGAEAGRKQSPTGQAQQRGNYLSPETERGIEWASLVDAATRAIEGMTQRALSNNGSPEFSSYHLRLEAAAQRVKLLEEKVDRLQTELDKERESKHGLEVEVLQLRDVNKRMDEECKNAKMELRKFTEWFFNVVENSNGQQIARPPIDDPSAPSIGDNSKKFPPVAK